MIELPTFRAWISVKLRFFLSGNSSGSDQAQRTNESQNGLQNICQVLRHPAVYAAMKFVGLILPLVFLVAGCTSVKTHHWTKADLRSYKHIYVETASNDSANIDGLIAAELQRLGFDATSGVRTMRPDNVELIVSYQGQWEWDFRLYLIQLSITARSAKDDQQLASTQIVHPGVTSKSPQMMVHEVLLPLFGPMQPGK